MDDHNHLDTLESALAKIVYQTFLLHPVEIFAVCITVGTLSLGWVFFYLERRRTSKLTERIETISSSAAEGLRVSADAADSVRQAVHDLQNAIITVGLAKKD